MSRKIRGGTCNKQISNHPWKGSSQMRRLALWLGLAAIALPSIADAQLFRPFRSYSVPQRTFTQVCPSGDCVVYTPSQSGGDSVLQLSTPEGIEEVASAVADGPHTRALVSGSCGSGTICGADEGGAYVVSNAHVWGTTIGKVVTIDVVADGQTKRLTGRIVFAGYSNSRMVDFAIAKFEGLTAKRYMPMLKTEPEGQPFGTTGSPRCVWPLVVKQFNNPSSYGQGLITGTPDAIGGQSGSAIYNAAGHQIALLTWSINGRCAGQKTSKLWEVASQRNVLLADLRPEGLQELGCNPETRPETEEGVFGEMPSILQDVADDSSGGSPVRIRPVTENVIASTVSTAMEDMPIWYNPNQPDPTPDPEPDPGTGDCYKLTDKEWALIQFLRAQKDQAAFGDAFRGIDWVALIKAIIEMIKLFQGATSTDVSYNAPWIESFVDTGYCLSA